MVTLYCDLGDTRDVACGLVEPLHFEDGYAEVNDEGHAEQIVARHRHIHYPRTHPDADVGTGESEQADDGSDEPETCDVVMSNGDVCGRSLPCGYHSDSP